MSEVIIYGVKMTDFFVQVQLGLQINRVKQITLQLKFSPELIVYEVEKTDLFFF